MMKYTIGLFCLCYMLAAGFGTARALDIQAAPVEQERHTTTATKKQPANIGPRETEPKTQGVGMDVILNKNLAICSSVSLSPYEQSGQTGTSAGISLNPSKLAGIVGFKIQF